MGSLPNLNKQSHVPLYRQLYSLLEKQIQSGELQAGEQIPSERELAETLHVSRITARQALDALVETGLVYREQGKGTFVAEPKMRGLLGFASFTEDMIKRGYKPSSRVITQELVPADAALQRVLKLDPDAQVVSLKRVRLADNKPIALQSSFLPYWICPGLEEIDLSNKSLFRLLRERYAIYPAWTEMEMEAAAATREEAKLLDVNPGDPVLVVKGLTFSETFSIVETVRTIYRGKGLGLYLGRQRVSTLEDK
ncbi:MAG: GntR family transcriptional regulator [Anaerolineales bacterium]|nr:GntR family transcriptional regulator [Anaerolineales bacterium]